MKPKHLIVGLVVLAFVLPIQGQKPPAPQPDQGQGRYQLLALETGEQEPKRQLFLLDSQAGRVWKYRPESMIENGPGKAPTLVPEELLPIMVLNPTSEKKGGFAPEAN